MKNSLTLVTLLCCLTCSQWLSAQSLNTVNYTFTKTTGTYANVANGTALNDGARTAIGFPFYHYGIRFDTLAVTMEGYIELQSEVNNCGSMLGAFVAFCDVDPNFADSGIKYKVSGNAGSRVMVIEWRNVAIDFPGTANNNDYVNFQIALFEGSNKIEYRYGTNLITDLQADLQGYQGPQVFHEISNFITFQTRNMWLYFSAASPSVLTDFTGADDNIVGAPANGTIYRFTPSAATGISYLPRQLITVYPNPATNLLKIHPPTEGLFDLVVQDQTGKVVYTEKSIQHTGSEVTVNCSQWAAGVYYALIKSEGNVFSGKVVKQ